MIYICAAYVRCGLDGPEFESRWRRNFPDPSGLHRGPPRPLYREYRACFSELKRQRRGVDHPPLLVLRLSSGKLKPLPPFSACLKCYGTAFMRLRCGNIILTHYRFALRFKHYEICTRAVLFTPLSASAQLIPKHCY